MANPYEDIFQSAINGDKGALYAGNVSTGDDWQKNLPSNEGLTTSPIGRPLQAGAKAVDQGVTNAVYDMRTSQLGENPTQANAGIIPASPERPEGPANPAGDAMMNNRGIIPTGSDNPPASTTGPVDPNSQAGGAQAAASQQSKADATAQQKADEATKGGVTPPPVTTQSPSETLAARNQNIQSGVGNPLTGTNTPSLPDPLTPQQQKNAALDKAGQDTFESMNVQPHWWQSGSILGGMMSMGLALLDGKGYSEAFQSGIGYYDKHYGAEQRGAWADDLLKKGYTRESIAQYIQSGDSKDLTNTQDIAAARQAKAQQYQIGQANLQGQQLQNSEMAYKQTPEYRNLERQNEETKNKYMLNQIQSSQFENSPEYQRLKMQGMQADIDYKKGQAAKLSNAGQTGGINVWQNPNNPNMKASIGGAPLLPGRNVYPILDSRGHYQAQKGFYQAIDTDTNQPVTIPANMQMFHQVRTNADNTIQAVNNFNVEGVKLAGPTGEISRDFMDAFGARNKADQASILAQLEGYQHNLAMSQASLEVGGGRPTDADVKSAQAAFPKYLDKDGEPVQVSKERMAQMFQNTLRQSAQIHNMANNIVSGNYEKNEDFNPQAQVARGQRMQLGDGRWYIATQSGSAHDRIWRLDPNQQGQ